MSIKSPLERVKEEFGGKDKLVDKIVSLIDLGDEPKDALRKRLLGAANGKLMRVFAVATRVKKEGGHDKLVAAAAASMGRGKDKDYVEKLGSYADARLLDILQAAERRSQRKASRSGGAASATNRTPARRRRPRGSQDEAFRLPERLTSAFA
jgi:hypothetical protein